MKATGLIVEYNPFHNGHLYHLTKSIEQSNADVLIVVMSGHFTQRGEPTILSKWDRTQLALANGADLVIELPYAYSCQHADLFAKGAVSILTHLRVNELIFGSESGNIDELIQFESITRHPDFQTSLHKCSHFPDYDLRWNGSHRLCHSSAACWHWARLSPAGIPEPHPAPPE